MPVVAVVPTTAAHCGDLLHHSSDCQHEPGGLADPSAAIPRECEDDGLTDSQQLDLPHSLAEHVQTVRGGGWLSMPGHGHGHGHGRGM